jgi:hypothetical protein
VKRISTAALVLATLLAGCNQSTSGDGMGPAQKAGKVVDEAGARVQGAVQQQVVKDAGGGALVKAAGQGAAPQWRTTKTVR